MKKTLALVLLIIGFHSVKAQCVSGTCISGWGKYYYGNGGYYEGYFMNSKEHGQGTLVFSSGAKYIGQFLDGKKHGRGTYYYTNGDINEGTFIDGQFTNGKVILGTGDIYEGPIFNGLFNGYGTYTWASGEKYIGEFLKGQFNGKGNKILANGEIIEGEWANNSMIKNYNSNKPKEEVYDNSYSVTDNSKNEIPAVGIDQTKTLYIHGFGKFTQNDLYTIKNGVENYYGLHCEIAESAESGDYYYEKNTNVLLAYKVLTLTTTKKNMHMYVTDEPLCSDNASDLISGHARINCDGSVVSTYEIRKNGHYTPTGLVSNATHELGHNFGLYHCNDVNCLMVALGVKNTKLCDMCAAKIKLNKNKVTSEDDPSLLVNKAQQFQKNGDYKSAIDIYSKMISLKPNFTIAYAMRGYCKALLKDFNGSYTDITYFINNPTQDAKSQLPDAHSARGEILLLLGRKQEACSDLLLAKNANVSSAIKSYNANCLANTRTEAVCNYKFVKPQLNITYIDNRQKCCYCNKSYAKYKIDSEAKNVKEINYLIEKLYIHFKETKADDIHKEKDSMALQKFIAENYSYLSSIGVSIGLTGAEIMDNKFNKPLANKNLEANKYKIESAFCSLKCEDDCNDHNCKCK